VRRGRLGLAVAAVVVGATSLLVEGPAAAGGVANYQAMASAEGVRVGIAATGAPVTNQVVDAASPVAQATLDSTNGSAAMASAAYPGDLVVTAPGLVSGLTAGQTSGVIPQYPVIAVAGSTSKPQATTDAPGATMEAAGDDRHAEATATTGPSSQFGGAGSYTASAKVTVDGDSVTSTASSVVTGTSIGPLAIGRVTATSKASRAPGQPVTRTATFAAEGITVAGVGVSYTPAGLVLAGTTVPLEASPLKSVLESAGLTAHVVGAENTDDGVVSAGLVITRTQDLPLPVSPASATYTIGRAVVSVANTTVASGVLGVADDGAPAANVPVAEGPDVSSAPQPAAVRGGGAGAPPATRATERIGTVAAAHRLPRSFDLRTVYAVLLVGIGLVVIVMELLRRRGVRTSWI